MTRPTKEDVDDALRWIERSMRVDDDVDGYYGVLAAEVKALREELAAVTSVPLFIEANESLKLSVPARYSTEAVDAAVAMYDRYCLHDMTIDEYDLGKALGAVRASREPPLK